MNQMRLERQGGGGGGGRGEQGEGKRVEKGSKNFHVIGFNSIRKRFFARALACPRSTLLKIAIEYAKRKLPKERLIRPTWLKAEGTKKRKTLAHSPPPVGGERR
jgi:hypothetical protein